MRHLPTKISPGLNRATGVSYQPPENRTDRGESPRGVARAYRAAAIALVVIYLALQSHLAGNVGRMLFRTNDESAYLDTVVRFQQGLAEGKVFHAFRGSTFAYGWGYYYVLAAASAPFSLLGIEPGFILALRMVNVLLWAACLWVILDLLRRHARDRAATGPPAPPAWWDIACIVLLCLMPGLHTVLILLKPEVLQALLLLLVIRQLWRWHEAPRPRKLVVCGIFLGACIAAKVSSILFVCVPGMYFLWRAARVDRLAPNVARGLIVGAVAGGVALALTFPIIYLRPATGLADVLGEYRRFAESLKLSDIAEIDLYRRLDSRGEAIRAWLTHPYSHGYVHWSLFYALAAVCAAGAWREWKRPGGFPLCTLALGVHAAVAAFFLATTSHLSVWYFFPTLVLLLPIALREAGAVLSHRRALILAGAAVLLAAALVGLGHSARLANDLTTDRARLFEQLAPRFEPVRRLIARREIPLGRIEFAIGIPLDLSMTDLRFRPCDPGDSRRETPRGTSRFVAFVGFPAEYASSFDLVLIDKRHHANTAAARALVKNGTMNAMYEDNYTLVLSGSPAPRHVKAFEEIGAKRWSGGIDGSTRLAWDKLGWQGLMQWWPAPTDLSSFTTLVLELDIRVGPSTDDRSPRFLRFGFRGAPGNDPATRSQRANQWDVDLFDKVTSEHVTLRVPLSEFRAYVFDVQWQYVTGAELGAYLPAGSEVHLRSFRLE